MPSKLSKRTVDKIKRLRSGPDPVPFSEVARLTGTSIGSAHKYGQKVETFAPPPVRHIPLIGGETDQRTVIPPLVFDPYDYAVLRNLHKHSEPALYKLYKKEWLSNPFVSLLVEFILNEVFGDGFHFEGPGADEVEDFFKSDRTRKKLKIAMRESVVYGNGFLSLNVKKSALSRTTAIPSETITIKMDENGIRSFFQKGKTKTGQREKRKLNPELLLHLTMKELADLAYGVSLLRPNLHFLRALFDVGGDIPAAIKRAAYSPIVAELDLEGYATETEKEEVVREYAKKLKDMASATTNYAIDARHRLRLLNEGAAGAMQMRVTQLIEPMLAVVLLNMGMPIGFFLQAASNRAVLREQREGIQRFISEIKSDAALVIETQVIPLITSQEVMLVWDMPLSDQIRWARTLATLYQLGIVSREYVLDKLDITDEGDTFFPLPGAASTEGIPRPAPLRDEESEVEVGGRLDMDTLKLGFDVDYDEDD